MKRLIYQIYVGKKSRLYDHCTKTVAEYCKRHDITHFVQTEPKLKIQPNPFTTNRSEGASRLGYLPIFEKENAFDFLENNDQVAIIDSDILIREDAPNIFEDLPKEYDFGAVSEREMPITQQYAAKIKNYSRMQYQPLANKANFKPNNLGYEFFNMGLMVMNQSFYNHIGMPASQWLKQPEFQPFIDGIGAWKWSTDQTLLNYFLKTRKVKVKHLDWKWNGLFTANTKIDKCHFVHFFLKDKLPNRGESVEQLLKSI